MSSLPLKTRASSDRGSALVAVLLLLLMMTALATALSLSGSTETLTARNHQTAAQARLAAEAGIAHVSQVALKYLEQQVAMNGSATIDTAVQDLLQNHATLFPELFSGPVTPAGANWNYEVSIIDDDDPARGYSADQLRTIANNENDNPDDDQNKFLVIQAIGHGPNNATAEVEAIIGPYKLPAATVNGDLEIEGNTTIVAGIVGGLHVNGNLTISGSATIQGIPDENGTARSSGTYTIETGSSPYLSNSTHSGGGYSRRPVPKVDADNYRSWADFVLTTDGKITNLDGTATYCDTGNGSAATACQNPTADPTLTNYGWRFTGAGWDFDSNTPDAAAEGIYFAEGTTTVTISGSFGSSADPHEMSLISRGSIDITGSPHVATRSDQILFLTEGDFRVSGNVEVMAAADGALEGQILVHEQFDLSGQPVIFAPFLVEDAEDTFSLVHENHIGSSTSSVTLLNLSNIVEATFFRVAGWRQVH